ncbi:MAG: hypothetical protein WDO13_00935 [Verrucomicrobiota bacterium]
MNTSNPDSKNNVVLAQFEFGSKGTAVGLVVDNGTVTITSQGLTGRQGVTPVDSFTRHYQRPENAS